MIVIKKNSRVFVSFVSRFYASHFLRNYNTYSQTTYLLTYIAFCVDIRVENEWQKYESIRRVGIGNGYG